jgi:hypothetical protein
VDLLNERRSSHVTLQLIGEVADGLVNNPLPQMIFLWDSLERDEKLVLALLAETLPDENAFVAARQLSRTISQREYPLSLEAAHISTALEKLFKADLLLKNDTTTPPGYAFRMDLWRLWIRRMHSVWQVMREAGIEIRPGLWARLRQSRTFLIAGVVALALLLMIAGRLLVQGERRVATPTPSASPEAAATASWGVFDIEVTPKNAAISMEDNPVAVGTGRFHGRLRMRPGGTEPVFFRITAPGYADSAVGFELAANDSVSRQITLRPLHGGLHIETKPPGALVVVDGKPYGSSPVTISGLAIADAHQVSASMDGHEPARASYMLKADTVTPVVLSLDVKSVQLLVNTKPDGAWVHVDGATSSDKTPFTVPITLGRHTFRTRLAGHADADTTVEVTSAVTKVEIPLVAEFGVLIILGDQNVYSFYVDGDRLKKQNVPNSGQQKLPVGSHRLRVEFASGDADTTVDVHGNEEVLWDFTKKIVNHRALPGR